MNVENKEESSNNFECLNPSDITPEKSCANNISNSKADHKKHLSYFELILKYKNKININYSEYDFQKGENSPRLLFKKRKSDNNNENLGNFSASKQSNIINMSIILDRNPNMISNPQPSNSVIYNQANPNQLNNSNNSTPQVQAQIVSNNISLSNMISQHASCTTLPGIKTVSVKEKDKLDCDEISNYNDDRNFNNTKIFKILHEHAEIKQGNKVKTTFENYLDMVHDSYFSPEEFNPNSTSNSQAGIFNNNLNNYAYNINNNFSNSTIVDPANEDEYSNNANNSGNLKSSEKKSNYINTQPNSNNNIPYNNLFNCFNNSGNPNLFKFSSLDLLVNPLRQKFIWETWSPYEIALFECCICKFGKNFDLYPKIVK